MLSSTVVEELDSPLLEQEGGTGGNTSVTSNGNSGNQNNASHMAQEELMWMNPTLKLFLYRCLGTTMMADKLPFPLGFVAANGKLAFPVLLVVYLVFVLLWLPFWLLSFILTEWGIYALFVGTVFLVGRIIIRLLAFPGSSHRIAGEIEKEFAKYSMRMLQTSAVCLIELANMILVASESAPNNQTYFEIASSWKRMKSYRDRVMAVYYEVLAYIYQEQRQVIPPESKATSQLTPFGNNRASGDVGSLSGITPQAQGEGRQLMNMLGQVLTDLNQLESNGKSLLNNNGRFVPKDALNDKLKQTAQALKASATELREFLPGIGPAVADMGESEEGEGADEEDVTMDTVRHQLEQNGGGTTVGAIKAAAGSFMGMLDPPLHTSIFGFDVLRGTLLSRYRGAEQLWIRRPSGGRIDAICIPAKNWDPSKGRNRKAVLYCNPNAGLIEVATGMSLASGNVQDADDAENCWTDFYTSRGYDMYLFNYAGFGRSHASDKPPSKKRASGVCSAMIRIFKSALIDFKPTPASLKDDAVTVGNHLITQLEIDSLTIHGESIGGMAAAGAARLLTKVPHTKEKVSLLICDRTFANLHAIAQRLVGGWTGVAIECLAPFWNTDVVADFLGASCPKIVANDSADSIIADAGSLRSGLSLWQEVRKEASTKRLGWKMEAPLEYQMADWEEVGVRESQLSPSTNPDIQIPVWPSEKHLSKSVLFHFAACTRRIGKLATLQKRMNLMRIDVPDEEHGLELSVEGVPTSPSSTGGLSSLFMAWRALSCCDGLCGSTLGVAVKNGYDWTLIWLACTVTFGGQTLISAAESRLRSAAGAEIAVTLSDFDCRPPGYEKDENDALAHPKPIPEVIDTLKSFLDSNDGSIRQVEHEVRYCIGVFEYVVARLSSSQAVSASQQGVHFQDNTGHFLDLHCGHNNQYSVEERFKLGELLKEMEVGGDESMP